MSALDKYPAKVEGMNYGFFGYHSALVDMIVRQDDVAALQEMLDAGHIKIDSPVLGKKSMHQYCMEYNATKCAALFPDA